jgi:hypothetical protein
MGVCSEARIGSFAPTATGKHHLEMRFCDSWYSAVSMLFSLALANLREKNALREAMSWQASHALHALRPRVALTTHAASKQRNRRRPFGLGHTSCGQVVGLAGYQLLQALNDVT